VGEVVQVDAGHGNGAQVFVIRGLGHLAFPGRVPTLKGPGGEGRVPTAIAAGQSPVLLLPKRLQVLDALGQGLGDAEHHGAGALQAFLVGGLHNLQPLLAVALERGDLLPDAVHQDFGTTSRQAAEARLLERTQGAPQAQAVELGHLLDFHGGETVHPNAEVLGKEAHQFQVIVPG